MHAALAELWVQQPEVGDQDRILFETAVAEVAANIVQHSRPAGRDDHLTLVLRADTARLEATFTDHGLAVDGIDDVAAPRELAESGRGLMIVRAAVDELTYQRVDDRNEWQLVRRLRPSSEG